MEETLKRIRSHRGVEGILIVNNDGVALKSTLSAELTSQYASLFSQARRVIVSVVRAFESLGVGRATAAPLSNFPVCGRPPVRPRCVCAPAAGVQGTQRDPHAGCYGALPGQRGVCVWARRDPLLALSVCRTTSPSCACGRTSTKSWWHRVCVELCVCAFAVCVRPDAARVPLPPSPQTKTTC